MKAILVLFAVLAFTACTKTGTNPICEVGKTVSGLVSSQVAVSLDCKNVDAIRADIDAQIDKQDMCKDRSAVKGVAGDILCPVAIDAIVAGALAQIPSAWECKGGAVTADVKTKLLEACKKAF